MIAISVVAITFAVCVRFTKHCICISIEIPILLIISIVLMVFGGFLVAPAAGGSDFVEDNCKLANEGDFDDMNAYAKRVFEPIADFDKQFQTGVNKQMCTDFCKCPGGPKDTHYAQYEAISDEDYKKFDRLFKYVADPANTDPNEELAK